MLAQPRLLRPALGCALALLTTAATAHAQTCPPTPAPACSPIGSPVTLSPSKHYFETYTTAPIFLVGLTPEYLCHVSQPSRQDQYCTLDNFPARFSEMQGSRNNVVRLEAIFDHSPGWMTRCNDNNNISRCPGLPASGCCGTVFVHEQPFRYAGNNKWSLNKPKSPGSSELVADLDAQYLTNLESVVCNAYSKNIVVEVSLFNVWDGRWGTSPFNPANTMPVNGKTQGFTTQGNFMTLSGTSQQDIDARNAQKGALACIVNQLKKYPNVIWEVANEPDLVDTTLAPPVTKEQVFAWQQAMIGEIVKNDPAPGDPTKAKHLIEIEGFTNTTFGWLDSRASIETSHYIQQNTNAGFYGALSLLRSFYPTISNKGVAVGFNENKSVPTPIDPDNPNDPNREIRTAADARAEAWEFALNGGALFNGYSINYGDPEEAKLRAQLKLVSDFLYPQGTVGPRFVDDMRQASCNNSTDWCQGIPAWGTSDATCTGNTATAYWSTLKAESDPYFSDVDDYALYIHHGSIVHANFAAYKAAPSGNGASTGYQLPNFQYRVAQSGCYFEWAQDPETGIMKYGTHRDLQAGNWYPALAASVRYKQDLLVFLTLLAPGISCFTDPPLTASFTLNCDYLWCTFDASSSSPSSVISNYDWNWGDGLSTSTGNTSQLHVYANPGSYNVTLTVSDLSNDSGSMTQPVTVVSQPPTPIFSAFCNSLTCTFDGSNSRGGSGALVSWSWSFGDGTSGVGQAPTHTYAVGGNYPVTLTVTDVYNVSASLTQTVTVTGPPPVASFLFTCSGLTCSFDASATTGGNPITTYAWSFGDNGSGSGVTTSYLYAVKGTYMVTLTVTDNVQRQSTFQKLLTVTNDPVLPAESYFALPPCRVLDTRIAPLAALNSGQAYTFQITGKCGIPSSAKAVSFNVTAVSPTGAGYIDLYPGDQTATFTTVDFDPARSPRANNTIEQLATNGAGTVGVLAGVAGSPGQVHLVLDVDGYFSEDTAPAPGAQGPLGYQTITPCRVVDTRTTNTPLASGTVRTFSIQGNCGIPVGAVTAALNAVIVAPSNLGFLALYNSQLSFPGVSNLNWVAGTTALANGARPTLAATSPNDLAAVFASVAAGNTAHLVLDTMGYFKSGAPYKFHPIAQCRAVWTAAPGAGAPSLAAGTTRSFQIQGNCGVPVGAKAAFISTKIMAPNTTAGGLLLLFPSGGSPNGTSFMNFDAGEPALAGGAIVELSNNNLDISVATSSNVDFIIKVFGYFQ